jgi:pilus assembly protein CpaE
MKALVISGDAELKARIGKICALRSPPITVLSEVPSMMQNGSVTSIMKPDMVLVDATDHEQHKLALLEKLAIQYPQAALVLLATHHSQDLLIAAMRAGVREVLALPLAHQDFQDALDRITHKLQGSIPKEGKVLSFISCKGGSGATFLASNLAYALAVLGHKKTLLIDLNLQFGDAALYLSDAKPTMTLADLCGQMNRLDEGLLESSLIRIAPNFGVLAASDDPDPATEIRPDHIEIILQLARKHYDFILLDIGRQINGVVIRALDGSDGIYPILQQSLPYMRDGRRLLDIFSSLGYRKEKIHLIVNRYDNSSKLRTTDMERALGNQLAHFIPNNFEITNESINQGVPALKLARSSNISKSLADFVNQLTEAVVPVGMGMIRRLFVRNPAPNDKA